ncbi:MAG: ubiquinone/menaquinone biosynthesis methyltransferase [Verrucomicrobiae bacterium]|nr:ubiquinone/menaquinone biosynthesis methyltransferase [Verrucomicrobiae bacterium]
MAKANRYYIPGEGRASGVRDLFASIAHRYDLINDLQSLGLHRWWKGRLIRWAGVRPGEEALDLCCGTGDIAFRLADEGARVTAVDFSEAMLAVARKRAEGGAGRGGDRVRFEQGDALGLAHGAGRFDLVTMAYGLRNLGSLDGGLAEMARVTRAGGRVLILDFGKPRVGWWRWLYFLHLRTVVPLLGRWLCGDTDSHGYILESLRRYPEGEEVARRMEGVGWERVEWWNLLGGVMTVHRGWRALPPGEGGETEGTGEGRGGG